MQFHQASMSSSIHRICVGLMHTFDLEFHSYRHCVRDAKDQDGQNTPELVNFEFIRHGVDARRAAVESLKKNRGRYTTSSSQFSPRNMGNVFKAHPKRKHRELIRLYQSLRGSGCTIFGLNPSSHAGLRTDSPSGRCSYIYKTSLSRRS